MSTPVERLYLQRRIRFCYEFLHQVRRPDEVVLDRTRMEVAKRELLAASERLHEINAEQREAV